MSLLALHPERRYGRTPIVSALIEQLGEGSAYAVYQLSHDERYRVLGEMNKVFANAAVTRRAWVDTPAMSLEEAAPLLRDNAALQARIAEQVAASDRSQARKDNIIAALANPERIVAALRLLERLPAEDVLFGHAVRHHGQQYLAALNFEIQALARARLDGLGTVAVDRDRVEEDTDELSAQVHRFLVSAMPLVASLDPHGLRQLARAFLGEVDEAVAEYAAKLVEQQLLLRGGRLDKKQAQVILDIDDALRDFLCAVAVAHRLLQLAESDPDAEMAQDYQEAAAALPFAHSPPNGRDTDIDELTPSDRLLEIYGVVRSVRVFREGADKVVTAVMVEDFRARHQVEVTSSYRNLLRTSLAAGSVINLNGEAYESEGTVKFRAAQVAYSRQAEESWLGFLHRQVLVDYPRYRGGLDGRWCSNLADGSWVNEPLDVHRLYRS